MPHTPHYIIINARIVCGSRERARGTISPARRQRKGVRFHPTMRVSHQNSAGWEREFHSIVRTQILRACGQTPMSFLSHALWQSLFARKAAASDDLQIYARRTRREASRWKMHVCKFSFNGSPSLPLL